MEKTWRPMLLIWLLSNFSSLRQLRQRDRPVVQWCSCYVLSKIAVLSFWWSNCQAVGWVDCGPDSVMLSSQVYRLMLESEWGECWWCAMISEILWADHLSVPGPTLELRCFRSLFVLRSRLSIGSRFVADSHISKGIWWRVLPRTAGRLTSTRSIFHDRTTSAKS